MKKITVFTLTLIGFVSLMSTSSCNDKETIIKQHDSIIVKQHDSIIYRKDGLLNVEHKRNNGQFQTVRNSWVSAMVDVTVPETGKYFVYATTPINFLTPNDWAIGRIFNVTKNLDLQGYDIGTGPLDVSGSTHFIANFNKSDVISSEVKLIHQTTASSNYSIGHAVTNVVLGIIKID